MTSNVFIGCWAEKHFQQVSFLNIISLLHWHVLSGSVTLTWEWSPIEQWIHRHLIAKLPEDPQFKILHQCYFFFPLWAVFFPTEPCLMSRSALFERTAEVLLRCFSPLANCWEDGGVFSMRYAVIIFILGLFSTVIYFCAKTIWIVKKCTSS